MKKTATARSVLSLTLGIAMIIALLSMGYLLFLRIRDNENWILAKGLPYRKEVSAASEKYGVEEARIYAVIQTESSFREQVVSKAGAIGLMQMMPATYEELCLERGRAYDPEDLKNPEINIDFCTAYLRQMYDRTGSWDLAHLSYLCGNGTVRKWLSDSNYSADGKTLSVIPSQTGQIYLERIHSAYDAYTQALKAEKPSVS